MTVAVSQYSQLFRRPIGDSVAEGVKRRVKWCHVGKGQSLGNAASWKGGSADGDAGWEREKGRESVWLFKGERLGLI